MGEANYRATVLGLLASNDDDALGKLEDMLKQAQATPNAKLLSNDVVETKMVRVQSRKVQPPGPQQQQPPLLPPQHQQQQQQQQQQQPSQAARPAAAGKSGANLLSSASGGRSAKPPSTAVRTQPSGAPAATTGTTEADSPTTAIVAGSERGRFCVCGSLDDDPDDTFIACTVGTGGCNGWVHLRCAGLSETEIDDIVLGGPAGGKKAGCSKAAKFVCSLCKAMPKAKKKPSARVKKQAAPQQEPKPQPPPPPPSSSSSTAEAPQKKRGRPPASTRENLIKKLKPSSSR